MNLKNSKYYTENGYCFLKKEYKLSLTDGISQEIEFRIKIGVSLQKGKSFSFLLKEINYEKEYSGEIHIEEENIDKKFLLVVDKLKENQDILLILTGIFHL